MTICNKLSWNASFVSTANIANQLCGTKKSKEVDEATVKSKIKQFIDQSLQGLEPENPKIDFKRRWYNLTNKFSISEFLRDTTAIINTNGFDGFIVIGYDSKDKSFHHSKFSDCGLMDTSHMQNLIIKNCSDIFTLNSYDLIIDSNPISVIHLPQYLNKPVLLRRFVKEIKSGIKEEFQRIFVRKNTRTDYANKNDIDMMYFERSYIKPTYECEISLINFSIGRSNQRVNSKIVTYGSLELAIENLGVRGLTFKSFEVQVTTKQSKEYSLNGGSMYFNGVNSHKIITKQVMQNQTSIAEILFSSLDIEENLIPSNIEEVVVNLTLTNNHIFKKVFELKSST